MSTDPTIIGSRYRLYEKLGTGGMGTVFRAEDRLTGAVIALKQVSANSMNLLINSKFPAANLDLMLANEFQALASLRHPNIISVLDYGFHDSLPFFTMHYIADACSITRFAQDQPQAMRVRLLAQMLRALAYLHRRGIIHRDLKPENALVSPEGHVYLLDFGLAEENPREANEGLVIGTLAYIAPEVLQGGMPSAAADLYAVGTIAYEMFAGRHPFNVHNASELVTEILKQEADATRLAVNAELLELIMSMLEKDPAKRPAGAEEALKRLQAIADVPGLVEDPETRNSYLQAARFVGRDQELQSLTDALDTAFAGDGSAWLIGGESGAGKSRLAEEVRTRALIKGALVLRGQAVTGGGLLYQIWREPLRRILLTTSISDIDAGILKELIPDIEQLIERPVAAAAWIDTDAHRKRLSGAILSLFRNVQTPTILLLEDLQWADDDLDVLNDLVAIASELPLLIVGTYRSDEAPELTNRLQGVQPFHLERLSSEEIAQLSQSMLGENGRNQQVLDLLEKETEGNIFFIVETVRVLAEEAGSLHNVGRMTLPHSVFAGGVQKVIERRLQRIPDTYRGLVNAAAVAGRRIDFAILQQIEPETDLEEWATVCVNAAVLSVQDGNYQFSHDKLREGLLKALDSEMIRRLNETIARAIETAYPADDARAMVLAAHWKNAGNTLKEADYCFQAGQQQRYINPAEARQFLLRTLEMIEDSDSRVPRIQQLLGDIAAGMSDSTSAERYYGEALTHAIQQQDNTLRAHCLEGLGNIALRAGQHDLARRYHREALEYAQDVHEETLIAQCLCSLGHVELEESAFESAIGYFNEAMQQAEAHDNKRVIGRILNNLGVIAYRRGNYQQAIDYFEKTLHMRRELGMRHGIAAGLNNLGVITEAQGNYQQAIQYHEESLKIKRELGDRFGMATSLHNLGICAMHLQKYDDAQRYLHEALAIARAIHSIQGEADTLNIIGLVIRRNSGNLQEAQDYFERSLVLSRQVNDRLGIALTLGNIADVLLAQQKTDEATTILRDALREADAIQALQPQLRAIMWFGKLTAMRGDLAEAIRIWSFVNLHEGCDGETRADSEQMLADVTEHLSTEAFVAAIEAGKQLSLETLTMQFLSPAV